jgi:hypothetical protein
MGVSMQQTARRKKPRGQAVVEFALILPVFLLLTLGIVDMARLFTAYIALTSGVSNAALYAAHGGYDKWCAAAPAIDCTLAPGHTSANPANIGYQIQVETIGLDQTEVQLDAPQCTTKIGGAVGNCGTVAKGTYGKVQISAHYPVTMLTPLMQVLLGGPVQLSAATTASTY